MEVLYIGKVANYHNSKCHGLPIFRPHELKICKFKWWLDV